MKCELCGKKFKDGQAVVPVEAFHVLSRGRTRFEPLGHGIHLDCIKEMLDTLRAATLALASSNEKKA